MQILLILVFLVVLTILIIVRRRNSAVGSSRRDPRPLWARIVCGVVAGAIVATLVAVTLLRSLPLPDEEGVYRRGGSLYFDSYSEIGETPDGRIYRFVNHHPLGIIPEVSTNDPTLLPWRKVGTSLVPATAILTFGGPALLFLLFVAILAAQCFTRRAVGLVVSCLCAILLVVALDRIVLKIHVGNLAPDKPPAVRAYARSQLDATFFFQKTAERLAQQ